MNIGERNERETGPRPADIRDTEARPRNWLVAMTLLMLRERRSYGYELMGRASEFGFGKLNPLTLYRTLRQMEKEGLCESEWEATEDGQPARRVYYITEAGKAHLDLWTQSLIRWQMSADVFCLIYGGEADSDGDWRKDGGESEEDGDHRRQITRTWNPPQ